MSKHRSATASRTPVQNARHAAVTQDSALLQDLMLALWAALPPGNTPAGGEKLGKVGKRSASPANLNIDAHDQLVLIVNGVLDLVMRARDLLGDRQATPSIGEVYLRQWSAAQAPRSNADYRQAYGQLKFLPGLLDRLHGSQDSAAEPLACRVADELGTWIRSGRATAGLGRPTLTFGECPLVYDDIRPCGDWDGTRWHPGMLKAYTEADWSHGPAAADVWCTGCGTRWTPAEYWKLVVTLADKEAG